jgi:Holliday junction DNA helicase RuvB
MPTTFDSLLTRMETPEHTVTLEPLDFNARSANKLRPARFDQMVGQERLKALFSKIVECARASGRTLDHILLVGSAGTGKTTLAQVIAHELDRDVYQLKAPVAQDVFEELARCAKNGDVILVDEVHMQVSGDRRGITQAADPETFFTVMEDKRLMSSHGMIEFPDVTFIGCTTDAGLLPEPFLERFPLAPQLDPYTDEDMWELAFANARSLRLEITEEAAIVFARACRDIPRQLNTYVRNAQSLAAHEIDADLAREIVTELNSTTLDGLTRDMQNMMIFLLASKRTDKAGNVSYQAGLSSIATACGKSRDSKAIALYVEPYLIQRGYVGVSHGGRKLTDTGIERARKL